jgi:sugar O-acyltransferase (sialic acid O-acetyltransferase NeuD family)
MIQPLYAVYGASGCGQGIMPLARIFLEKNGISLDRLVFVDDVPPSKQSNGHAVLRYDDFFSSEASVKKVAIAIANGAVREKLAGRLMNDGIELWSISALNIIIMDNVIIGEGALLSPFVSLTSNISIGQCFHANLYSYVEHDCEIGNFVTFAPGVKCNGNVVIEDFAYIGSGAIIKQGFPGKPLTIGRGAVVGMGAVVTKDVPPGVTVIGNPARPLKKR